MIEESFLRSNFAGRDGFRWWIGQVPPVENHDKQFNKQGWGNRCKVRIMGYHPYTQNELSDEDLPWAQILLPTTAGSGAANYATNVKVRPGDIVFGFFLDGDNGQIPVIVGCFGRTSQVSSSTYKGPFIPFSGYTDRIPPPNGTLVPEQSNEQNTKSQKSPRSISPKLASQLNNNLKGFEKEISYFSGIKNLVIFANYEKDVGLGSIFGEVGNLLGRVAGIPNLGGVLNSVAGVAGNIASGNIAGAVGGALGSIGGVVGGNVGNLIGQAGNVASAAISGNISSAIGGTLGAIGGITGGTTANILGQVSSISTAALSGNVGSALGTFGSLVGGNVGGTLSQLGGFIGNGSVGSVLGSATSILGGNVNSILGSLGGSSALSLLGEINSSVSAILGMTNGIVGAMFNTLFKGLIPILQQGLALLYRTVFAKVYAATPGEHAIKFAAAHAAGVLAQKSMIPFVKKLEEAISCKAASCNNRLERPIRELLIEAIRNIQNFIPCAQVQFGAALNNHIIDKIKEELADELKGVAKILSPDFDVKEFLKRSTKSFSSIGGLYDCNQDKSKSKGNVKEWEIGCGPKGSVKDDELYNQILNAMKLIEGTGKDNDEFNTKFGEWPIFNNPKFASSKRKKGSGSEDIDKDKAKSQKDPKAPKGPLSAKFIQKRGSYFVEVSGDGSVEIEFTMDVDDNSFTAGIAASEIIVPSDKGNISFKRKGQTTRFAFAEGSRQGQRGETGGTISSYDEKQVITKKSKFTGGKVYGPIQIIGASAGASSILANDKRIDLRDTDGNDANIKFSLKSPKLAKPATQNPTNLEDCICDDPEVCNPPEIIIFGGKDGDGATAIPILGNINTEDNTGGIIGARVINPGSGYNAVPNIDFFDNCGRGYGAIARAIVNEYGQVDTIYIVSPGEGYPIGDTERNAITDVYIEDPGRDYDETTTVTDEFGNDYEVIIDIGEEDSTGSILKVRPINIIVVNTLPTLTVISSSGSGAILRPIIGPAPTPEQIRSRRGGELKQVIDCIL